MENEEVLTPETPIEEGSAVDCECEEVNEEATEVE